MYTHTQIRTHAHTHDHAHTYTHKHKHTQEFLLGANSIDDHFRNMPLENNLPVLLGLMSVWNVSFLGYPARAILPYCQV
jgi:glucose-6-phosphate isomerase